MNEKERKYVDNNIILKQYYDAYDNNKDNDD